jgi:thioredoxin-like negative regulator of GroEL
MRGSTPAVDVFRRANADISQNVVVAPETRGSPLDAEQRPRLVFFHSPSSGRCRRAEGYLAQVLQRRRNHRTFDLRTVSVEQRPDLAERFGIEDVPTILVIEDKRIRTRITSVRNCRELEGVLQPWLR